MNKGKDMLDHLQEMLNEIKAGTAQLFDVREQNEWDLGHLKLASLVPLTQLNEGALPDQHDTGKKTYLHCRSGVRVQMAAPLLQDLGFQEVIPLSEGYDELVQEGLE